jgi:signal peptidase I
VVCCPDKYSPFLLKLSNNAHYIITACDSEAELFVAALARMMKLKVSGSGGRQVLVYVDDQEKYEPDIILPENKNEPILCPLIPAENNDIFVIQVEKIARAVVADITRVGGALIHGGLCSYKGLGAVMAGPGGIGKTTASNRLPVPWISHSDDAALLIPNDTSGFNAHPWPTWSRYLWNGGGGNWAVEKYFPLVALFFLKQSKLDIIEPLDKILIKSMLIEYIEQVMRVNKKTEQDKNDIIKRYINSADKISSAVPAYRLSISLEGEFWREMEKVMPDPEGFEKPKNAEERQRPADIQEKLHFIYRGPSMNPTFFEPEILTIESYGTRKPKKGDVICYRVEQENKSIVHRIIAVKGSSLKTKGDNSARADDYLVDNDAVIGRVTRSTKNNVTRTIYSGISGIAAMYLRKISHRAIAFASKLLRTSYYSLVATGIFRQLKPQKMVFKVAVFEPFFYSYPKLIFNGRTVGIFNFRTMAWQIKKPYHLFIDENELPLFEDPLQKDR